ncbi:MAG TPA: aspartate aminotransferase family protein [Anaerolineales bacterium]|nr:aspartate aminotransferase family protein [Anaerolineales bacterium]
MTTFQELETQFTSGVYGKRNLTLVRGQGSRLWDDQNREYIDCASGISVANIGHCHPAVVQAITAQAQTLLTCSEAFYNDRRAQLLQKLTRVAPRHLQRVFLCNSGTEANEAAIKFARASTGRTGLISTKRSFHGRSMGALSLTGTPKYQEPFLPLLPDVTQVAYEKLDELAEAMNENTAAVFVEVVQGEGGVRPASQEYLQGVQALCRQHGALLVVDEIQTGLGRTGKWFASEHSQIQPDIITLAKSLGGGFPIGAVLMTQAIADKLEPGMHGSTFGGNPLACAAAIATLEVLEEENLPQRAAILGQIAFETFTQAKLPIVREVRGLGLMVGLELKQKVAPYLDALQEKGVIALNAGPTTLRLLPPLIISEEDWRAALAIVLETLASNLNAKS